MSNCLKMHPLPMDLFWANAQSDGMVDATLRNFGELEDTVEARFRAHTKFEAYIAGLPDSCKNPKCPNHETVH